MTAAENPKVPARRLEHGTWNFTTQRTDGEGDIARSYSADRICEGKPIRHPFNFNGEMWCCVSSGPGYARAYKLVALKLFKGTTTTYATKGEARGTDPLGMYHGMVVKHGKEKWVLCGPATTFTAESNEQPGDVAPTHDQLGLF